MHWLRSFAKTHEAHQPAGACRHLFDYNNFLGKRVQSRHELTTLANPHLLRVVGTTSEGMTTPSSILPSSSPPLSYLRHPTPLLLSPINLSSKKKTLLINPKKASPFRIQEKIYTFLCQFIHILILNLLHLTLFILNTEKYGNTSAVIPFLL